MYNIEIIEHILNIYVNSYHVGDGNEIPFVKSTNILTKAKEDFDNFMMCHHKNDKESVIDYHFHLLKNYNYINGIINQDVKITEKGQELYDLLTDDRIGHAKTSIPLNKCPLSIYHEKLRETLKQIISETYNGKQKK